MVMDVEARHLDETEPGARMGASTRRSGNDFARMRAEPDFASSSLATALCLTQPPPGRADL